MYDLLSCQPFAKHTFAGCRDGNPEVAAVQIEQVHRIIFEAAHSAYIASAHMVLTYICFVKKGIVGLIRENVGLP